MSAAITATIVILLDGPLSSLLPSSPSSPLPSSPDGRGGGGSPEADTGPTKHPATSAHAALRVPDVPRRVGVETTLREHTAISGSVTASTAVPLHQFR